MTDADEIDWEYEFQEHDMIDFPVAVLVMDPYVAANDEQFAKLEDLLNSYCKDPVNNVKLIEDIIGEDSLPKYFKRLMPDAREKGLGLFKLNQEAIEMLCRRLDLCIDQSVSKETVACLYIRLGINDEFMDRYRNKRIVGLIARGEQYVGKTEGLRTPSDVCKYIEIDLTEDEMKARLVELVNQNVLAMKGDCYVLGERFESVFEAGDVHWLRGEYIMVPDK